MQLKDNIEKCKMQYNFRIFCKKNYLLFSEYIANWCSFFYNRKKGIGVMSMDKYYSYSDFLRTVGQYPQENECEKLLNDIYLDLFLNRLLRLSGVEQLEKLIDQSLEQKNEVDFMCYTSMLNELLETSID